MITEMLESILTSIEDHFFAAILLMIFICSCCNELGHMFTKHYYLSGSEIKDSGLKIKIKNE